MEVLEYGPSVRHLEGQEQWPIFPRAVRCNNCVSILRVTSTDDVTFMNGHRHNDIRWSCPLCGEAYQQYSIDKYTGDQLRTLYRAKHQEELENSSWFYRWLDRLFGGCMY